MHSACNQQQPKITFFITIKSFPTISPPGVQWEMGFYRERMVMAFSHCFSCEKVNSSFAQVATVAART